MSVWKTNIKRMHAKAYTGNGSHYACCTIADCISTPTGALSTPTSKFLATGLTFSNARQRCKEIVTVSCGNALSTEELQVKLAEIHILRR